MLWRVSGEFIKVREVSVASRSSSVVSASTFPQDEEEEGADRRHYY